MAGKVYIGTSGWHYKHWLGPFYPEKFPASEMFNFYAQHLDTVEVNNSFYHLPAFSTFESWRDDSPRNFVFAVKGSRFITHMKKLKAPKTSTEKFFRRVERLETKLGPILFQLPPRWHVNHDRLDAFLNAIPEEHRCAFEFRDRSWLVDEVYDCLRGHNAAFCIYDLTGFTAPLQITADFVYLRMHGPGGPYQGDYPREVLREWAGRIRRWRRRGQAVYVYFNNDQRGFALKNARELREMI